ncbi:hypothetical protein BOTBODRAFT_103218, partial [Botryobasidium botryosum FD-172 SS1]
FQGGADSNPLAVCAICLGRHRHNITKCAECKTWDGQKAHMHRNGQGRIVNPDGLTLCFEWNRPHGCPSASCDHIHECAGCSKSDHGVQACPFAQKE